GRFCWSFTSRCGATGATTRRLSAGSIGAASSNCWAGNRRERYSRLRRRDSERLHLAIKVAAFEAQRRGRARHVPLVFFQLAQDKVAFIGGTSFMESGVWLLWTLRRPAEEFRWERMRLDALLGADNHQALDQVLQLANVAGPRITQEHLQRRLAQLLGPTAVGAAELAQEISRQSGQVLDALAQRGHVKRNYVQPVEQ